MESALKLGEALVTAAASDNVRRLKSYQLAGVDLSLQDACGRSALHAVSVRGCKPGVKDCRICERVEKEG